VKFLRRRKNLHFDRSLKNRYQAIRWLYTAPPRRGFNTRWGYQTKNRLSQRTKNVSLKTQILINLIVLAIVDTVIPIPITAMVLIMVLFQKPKWFKDWVDRIYRH